ncbi:MAG: hypothetical protein AB1716_14060, partial [Planctomycetota bacterium]
SDEPVTTAPQRPRAGASAATSRPAKRGGAAARPAPAPAPNGQPAVNGSEMVYVTPHGRKYHRKDCQYCRNGAEAVTVRDAKARGCTACSRCKPPS